MVFPASYTFPLSHTTNGSSATGHCRDDSTSTTSRTVTCADPTSSVLFDDPRGMPVLDGNMWASQLLTIRKTAFSIIFDFRDTPGFTRVERLEVMMFNCPQWGIGVKTIEVIERSTTVFTINVDHTITSCNSLVRLCLQARVSVQVINLRFYPSPGSDWVHVAEVTFWNDDNICPPDIVITSQLPLSSTQPVSTSQALEPTTQNTTSPHITLTPNTALTNISVAENTTSLHITPYTVLTSGTDMEPRSLDTTIIAVAIVFFLLLLVLVGVVVVVLVLWRCRHQYTAKEEASHTSSQTHTHPVVSMCEETGQVQYVSEEQQDTDQDSLYSSIPPQHGQERREVSKDDIMHVKEDEMGGYDVILFALKPSEEREREPMVNSDNYALLKDVSTPSLEVKTQFDYKYATVDNKMGGTENNIDHLPQLLGEESLEDQLYAKTKRFEEKEPTSSPGTAVDQLYAQVDKKKQKSKEKEVCPEESGAVYSVVNKPSPPQVPTKSQELLEELATSQCSIELQ